MVGEKKYAIANLYGYGGYAYYSGGYGSPHYAFSYNSSIYFKNLNCSVEIEPLFKKIQITQKNSSGYYYSRKVDVPLYLVEEGGVWREYFTGTEIKFFDFSAEAEKGNWIIRELVFGNSSGGTLMYTEPKVFANQISQYSEEQIRDMVSQFYRLCNDAVQWSKNYDKAPEKHRQMEWKKRQENILAAESLERSIGKYANASSKRTVSPAEESQNGRGGWLMGVIVILVLLLFVWWVCR